MRVAIPPVATGDLISPFTVHFRALSLRASMSAPSERIFLQGQLVDLGAQRLEIDRRCARHRYAAEHVGRKIKQLSSPVHGLRGAHLVLLRNLDHCLIAIEAASATLALSTAEWLPRRLLLVSFAPVVPDPALAYWSSLFAHCRVQIRGVTSIFDLYPRHIVTNETLARIAKNGRSGMLWRV